MSVKYRVLVVDDEESMREVLTIVLENAGYDVVSAAEPDEAKEAMSREQFDAVLTDLRMGSDRMAGLGLLDWLRENAPTTPAIMITAHGSVETAIEAMKLGAADYVQKPFKSNDEIRLRVQKAIEQQTLRRENAALKKAQAWDDPMREMVGDSPAFREVKMMIRRVANLPSTVAIHGESGAGKELVARELHRLSDRAAKPFVAINCGGIPDTLLESELFGYKRGAFTGANEDKEGLFVVASGGTLMLDEIGEMPMMLQVKLLRVLDDNTITPVGGTSSTRIDVRVISATNRNLEKMIEEGDFRKDLYYRLNVIPLHVPPLRERTEDILLLAQHFMLGYAASMDRRAPAFSAEARDLLMRYSWPGNVRELRNVMERTIALCGGDRIEAADLPPNIQHYSPEAAVAPALAELPSEGMDLEGTIAELEQSLIRQALERGRFSQKRAAGLLGLTPRSLRYRLQKYNLEAD